MNKKSLIANWIAKCDREIDKSCQRGNCSKCRYRNICIKVMKLHAKFKREEHLDDNN